MKKSPKKDETIQEKQQRVAKEIQEILDKEEMEMKIGQIIQVLPKQ